MCVSAQQLAQGTAELSFLLSLSLPSTYTNKMKPKAHNNEESESEIVTEKSAIAKEIETLQETILRLARDRERLPQPLFWSLFNSRITDIKRNKELSRLLKDVLG